MAYAKSNTRKRLGVFSVNGNALFVPELLKLYGV
jgi:hypothetical protein